MGKDLINLGRLIMVTGGARSGKSTFAERLAAEAGNNVLYVATAIAFDDEMKERIRKHRDQRPSHWQTVEAYKNLDETLTPALAGKSAVLLDCMTVMISNIMLEAGMDWESISVDTVREVEANVRSEIEKLLDVVRKNDQLFIIVTNELGMGVVPPTVLGRAIRDIAGRMNQLVAKEADEVYLCVSGIPVKIKDTK